MALLTDISEHPLDLTSATAIYSLGDFYYDSHGNKYVYAVAGESLTKGWLLMKLASVGVDTVASGSGTAVYLGKTYGINAQIIEAAAGWTPGAYAGWMGVVDDGTGAGQTFEVDNNDATTLYLKEPLVTALSVADSDITIFTRHTLVGSTNTTKINPFAITPRAITSGHYFWAQTEGVGIVLVSADTSAKQRFLVGSSTDAAKGHCDIAANTDTLDAFNPVGIIIEGSTDTTSGEVLVKLCL